MIGLVMAGGRGSRLRPLTDHIPKPLVEVGGVSLIKRVVANMVSHGIDQVFVSTYYKAEMVEAHLDGCGLPVSFIREYEPGGTAEALRLLMEPGPVAMSNADILCRLDWSQMLADHRSHHADATIATRLVGSPIPYGVIETDDEGFVTRIEEKPAQRNHINAGAYIIGEHTRDNLPSGEMTDVMQELAKRGRVYCCNIRGYWRDIGTMDEFGKAQRDFLEGKI